MKNKEEESRKYIKRSIFICVFIALTVLILFSVNQTYDRGLPIASDIFGQYGDFIGGVVGTVLSVILLYFTFKSQILESKKNANVFCKQQLNDTFYRLMDQYDKIVNTLEVSVQDEETSPQTYKGKEAIHYYLLKMQEDFNKGNISQARKNAINCYLDFFSSHKDFAPIYFRTIYRLIDCVVFSSVNDDEKVKYIKIFRSQLTDSELVLMRYNAMTPLGKKMQQYIIDYNLLKHIAALEILEYRKIKQQYEFTSQNKVNTILYIIRKNIHDIIKNKENTSAHTSSKAKYHINVSRLNQGKTIKLDFCRRTNIIILGFDDFICFDAIPLTNICTLFEEWLKDIFIFSSFGKVNGRINIERSIEPMANHKEHFSITINRKDGKIVKV